MKSPRPTSDSQRALPQADTLLGDLMVEPQTFEAFGLWLDAELEKLEARYPSHRKTQENVLGARGLWHS